MCTSYLTYAKICTTVNVMCVCAGVGTLIVTVVNVMCLCAGVDSLMSLL